MTEQQAQALPFNMIDLSHKLALSPAETAALTGIGAATIRQAIREGRLPAKVVGRDYHILPDDLRVWLADLPYFNAERPARIVQTQGPRRR